MMIEKLPEPYPDLHTNVYVKLNELIDAVNKLENLAYVNAVDPNAEASQTHKEWKGYNPNDGHDMRRHWR